MRRWWGWVGRAAFSAALACVLGAAEVAAGEQGARATNAKPPTQEVSTGIDLTQNSWSAYVGYTSTFGRSIRHDGWRYRITSGYGEYSYSSRRWTGANVIVVPFEGTMVFADVLLGYQQTFGPLTLKLYGGISAQDHAITPFDIENPVQGTSWGAKAAVESWLNIGDSAFAQLDLSYATANESYASRLRLGYRLWPQLSAGLEAGFAGSADYGTGRAGAFVRYEQPFGEMSVSGGMAGDRSETTGAYGTLNFLLRF